MSHEWLDEERFRLIERALVTLVQQQTKILGVLKRMNATVDALSQAVDNLSAAVTTGLQDLADEITNLKNADNGIDPTLLQPISDKVNALIAKVQAADPGPQTSNTPGTGTTTGTTTGSTTPSNPTGSAGTGGTPVTTDPNPTSGSPTTPAPVGQGVASST